MHRWGRGSVLAAACVPVHHRSGAARVGVIPLLTRGQPAHRLVLGGLVAATAALATATVAGLAPFSYMVTGFVLAPVFPTTMAWLAQLVPAARQANALSLTASMAGRTVFPLLIGMVAVPSHPATIPITLTTIGVLALLSVMLARVAARRRAIMITRSATAGTSAEVPPS